MNVRRAVIGGVVAVVVLGITAFGVDRMLLVDLRAQADRAQALTGEIARYQEAVLAERRRVNSLTRDVAPLMLAGDADQLQHTFRSLLAGLGAQAGLREVTVSSATPSPQASPVGNSRVRSTALRRRLRAEPGVSMIRGSVRGVATLEQAFELLIVAERQPWVHRVEAFEVAPAERTRERFTIRLDVATVRVAGIAAEADGVVVPASEADQQAGEELAQGLAFRAPEAPPPPAPPVRVATPQAPAPPEFESWRVSAVVERSSGVEVWLVREGGGNRSLLPGDGIGAAVFESGDTRTGAVFEIDGVLWRVGLGRGLRERERIEQGDLAGSPEGGAVASGAGE